jgi:RND family efflux transporter MFP subunit
MRLPRWLTCATLLAALAGCEDPPTAPATRPGAPANGDAGPVEVTGRTQCAPGRKAAIAPVPLHPVVAVLVAPGDRVKKGQPLVKIDADEPEADVRAKEAVLEGARVALAEARRYLARVEGTATAVPEQSLHNARVTLLKAETDERAAKAALEAAKAELEHYVVEAQIDGVVSWLDVYPGMVSRPGTTLWGEILDLRELDVRCEVTPAQADRLAAGQAADLALARGGPPLATGRVAYVGVAADPQTGLVPVLVRLANPGERLRCGVPVHARFRDAAPASADGRAGGR